MGVGHVSALQGRSWTSRQSASDADLRTAGGKRDAIRFDRGILNEPCAQGESGGDRVEQRDYSWSKHGAFCAICFREAGNDDVRADGLAVGHIAAVPARAQLDGQPACIGDGGAAGRRERDAGLLCGSEHGECGGSEQPGGDGVVERDGAWVEPRADDVHSLDARGQDCVRADDVGGRHVPAMPGGAGCDGEPAGGDQRWGEVRQRELWSVFRGEHAEHHTQDQQRIHGVGQRDGARSQHGAGCVHCFWSSRANDVRAVDVGVGHVGAMPELSKHVWQQQDIYVCWPQCGIGIVGVLCAYAPIERILTDEQGSDGLS